MRITTKRWIALAALAVLSPIGLYLPQKFKAGSAWGEWGADEMKNLVGYVPSGLEKMSSLWKAFLPDYAFKGMEHADIGHLSLAYIITAIVGILLCIAGGLILGKLLAGKNSKK